MRSLLPFSRFSFSPAREGEKDALTRLRGEVDRLFDDFFTGWPSNAITAFAGGYPKINVSETDKVYEVEAELPGLDEKDIDVVLAERTLTIRGERKNEREDKKKDYHLIERSYGSFSRSIQLPFDADPKAVNAEFRKGILHVTIEKPAEVAAKTVKIDVKPAS